jgi:oxygen-independent coproporphyrinogen-3 oxidase
VTALPVAAPDPAALAIYVHWPFCAAICPYCDFNVHKDRGPDAARWAAALTRELEHWAALTPGRRVTSLYFGGGTPSLAPLNVIEGVIGAAARLWGYVDDSEITLEANPVDAPRFAEFHAAGINRLSLGVQSFDDASLKFLGRDHDARAARGAIDAALALFARVSADIIYARPGQTLDQWTEELGDALAAGLSHLSLYQLTIEPGTAFDRQVAKGRWAPAEDGVCADMFDAAQAITAGAGLAAYEISNHAREGHRSRHNETYWRQGDYIGVGPGAHGRVTTGGVRRATETARAPAGYLARVERDGHALTLDDALTTDERRIEKFAMGLRTVEGVAADSADLAALGARADALVAEGFLTRDGARLAATADGRRLLNAVLARLFA